MKRTNEKTEIKVNDISYELKISKESESIRFELKRLIQTGRRITVYKGNYTLDFLKNSNYFFLATKDIEEAYKSITLMVKELKEEQLMNSVKFSEDNAVFFFTNLIFKFEFVLKKEIILNIKNRTQVKNAFEELKSDLQKNTKLVCFLKKEIKKCKLENKRLKKIIESFLEQKESFRKIESALTVMGNDISVYKDVIKSSQKTQEQTLDIMKKNRDIFLSRNIVAQRGEEQLSINQNSIEYIHDSYLSSSTKLGKSQAFSLKEEKISPVEEDKSDEGNEEVKVLNEEALNKVKEEIVKEKTEKLLKKEEGESAKIETEEPSKIETVEPLKMETEETSKEEAEESEKEDDNNRWFSGIKVIRKFEKFHKFQINCLCLLDDGRFASCGADTVIKIFSFSSNKTECILKGHTSHVISLMQLKNKNLVSSSRDGTVRIWEKEDARFDLVTPILRHGDGKEKVCKVVSIDDERIASCGFDKNIVIWKLKENTKSEYQEEKMLKDYHKGHIASLLVLRNQTLVVSAGANKIVFWQKTTPYEIKKVLNDINCCSWNALIQLKNNDILVGGKGKIFVIDSNSLELIKIHSNEGVCGIKGDTISACSFYEIGKYILCGCSKEIFFLLKGTGKDKYSLKDKKYTTGDSIIISMFKINGQKKIVYSFGSNINVFEYK